MAAGSTTSPRLSVDVGFGGVYRVGDWTPLYVTAECGPGERPREARLEVWAYQDGRLTIRHDADVPLMPGRHTFVIPVRMGGFTHGHSVVLRTKDAAGPGRALAWVRLGDKPPAELTPLATPTRLVVLAAAVPTGELSLGDFVTRSVPLSRLPDTPELLEAADLVVLTGPGVETLSPRQWTALGRWVTRGGRLLVAVPPEGLPDDLPLWTWAGVRMGPLVTESLLGPGRALLGSADDVRWTPLEGPLRAASRSYGLGDIHIAPVPLTTATQSTLAQLVGELPPRLAADLPNARQPGVGGPPGWAPGVLAVGVVMLLADTACRRRGRGAAPPSERTAERMAGPWVWRSAFTVASACILAGLAGMVMTGSDGRTRDTADPPRRVVDDLLGLEQLETRLAWPPPPGQAQAEPADFPHPIAASSPGIPAALSSHRHAHLVTKLVDGRPVLTRWPADVAVITTRVHQPAEQDPTAPRSTADAETYLESRGRVVRGRWPSPGTLPELLEGPAVALPTPLAFARRLTPHRSQAIQRRADRGDVVIVWTRQDDTVTRQIVPAGP
ncbi:MAG: hypothetical protein ACK4PI_06860 [Tepidisphaerales bacterium]